MNTRTDAWRSSTTSSGSGATIRDELLEEARGPAEGGRVEGAPAPRSARVAPGGTRKAARLRATQTSHVHLLLTGGGGSVALLG